MKFKYIGDVEAINLNLRVKLQPGDPVDVPDDDPTMIQRFKEDPRFEAMPAVKTVKPKAGDE